MATNTDRPVVNEGGYIIEISGATVMQDDNIVLRDVNLQVKSGEFLYVIGRVGSGKSSLLKTLYAELPFEGREGFVAGFELDKLRQDDIPYLRRRMGIVFQDFQLLSDRAVYDNLEFAKAKGLLDCIECGSCSFICPSDVPLVQMFKLGKKKLRDRKEFLL